MNLLLLYIRERTQNLSKNGVPPENGKDPIEVVLVDHSWEKCDDFKKPSNIRTEFFEHWGGEGKLDRRCEALLVFCLKHVRLASSPFRGQSMIVPLVLMCNGGQQGHRERMTIELLQDVVN